MKNKGFTLVELLAIIALLGIIVILVFPNIGESIDSKKEKELDKVINVVENAGKAYFSFNEDIYKVDINTLIDEKYLTNELINPSTEEKIEGCVRKTLNNENIFIYTYGSCESVTVSFDYELGEGQTTQTFQDSYEEFTRIDLIDPTHPTMTFKGWEIVKGNSIIKDKTLIIGTTETTLSVIWE